MSFTDHNLLSLSFSRNRLSYAVFRKGHLDYYAGKTLRPYREVRARNRALIATVKQLLVVHDIRKLVLPALNKQQRRSSDLRRLYQAIQRFGQRNQLTILMQDPVLIRRNLTGTIRPTQANAVVRLVELFPELGRYTSGGSEWERTYYRHVFTAIGSGLTAVGYVPATAKGIQR